MEKTVVIATNNAHKVEEIRTALDFPGWRFVTLAECEPYPEPAEDADDFIGNAFIKAQAAHMHTGLAALADDSGLIVDALGGEPGVFSARYAGVFGYDPLFLPDAFGQKKTLAEVGQDEKNAISHRGNALRALKAKLQAGLQ